MKIKTSVDGITWISDDSEMYVSGTVMVRHGLEQITLRKEYIDYDYKGNKRISCSHKASFFVSSHSLYVRLNELISRRVLRYGYKYNR
ncbi:MAG: hypothetical protein SVR08_14155 [Spirochaetota bacterium]|nr:hypothetical protein [Spirochaetota bacterium]